MGFSIPGAGAVGKALDWGKDKAADAADQVVDVAQQGARAVVHTVARPVAAAAPVADRVRDRAVGVLQGARERVSSAANDVRERADRVGDLAARAWDATRTLATPGGYDRGVHDLTAPVDDLDPGDSLTLEAGVEVNAGVSASGEAAVNVSRNDDGTYTITGSVDASVGGKISESGLDFGGGAGVEFTVDNAAEARDIAATLVKTGVANGNSLSVAGPVVAPLTNHLYGPSHDELAQLRDNLSAIEVEGSVAAGLGGRLGLTPDLDLGAEAAAQGDMALRIEFDAGRPSAAVLRTTAQADGDVGAGMLGLLPSAPLNDLKRTTGVDPRGLLGGGDAAVSVTVEQRVDLKTTGSGRVGLPSLPLGPLASMGPLGMGLPGIVPDGEPTAKVTVAGDATAEAGRGVHAELSVDGLNPSELARVVFEVSRGDVAGALNSVDAQVAYDVHGTRVKNDGVDVDIIVGGVRATRTVTQVEAGHAGTLQIGGGGSGGNRTGQAEGGRNDGVHVIGLQSAGALPYAPDWQATPDILRNPPRAGDEALAALEFEKHVGLELARGLGLDRATFYRAFGQQGSPLPADRNAVDPRLLHEPRLNAGGGGSGTAGSGGAGEPFRRPDWVVVQKDNTVLAVEVTLDSNFQVQGAGGQGHKPQQVQGTIDALVNKYGSDRPIHYVIRSPDAPGPNAQRALDALQTLLQDPKYANVSVTWVAG
jgi:hypothetical protein